MVFFPTMNNINISDTSILSYNLTSEQFDDACHHLSDDELELIENDTLILEIKWKYFHDKGRYDDIPENCYPEEETFESQIEDIYFKVSKQKVPNYIIDILQDMNNSIELKNLVVCKNEN